MSGDSEYGPVNLNGLEPDVIPNNHPLFHNKALESRVVHLEAALVRVLKMSDREKNHKISNLIRDALKHGD